MAYRWWYLDALSDDGAEAVTVIFFIGSVFSPYYAGARRRGSSDPTRHCACNIALYARRCTAWAPRWAMTERGTYALEQQANSVRIGSSQIAWDGNALHVCLDERTAPLPRRLRGRISLRPTRLFDRAYALDIAGRHQWAPLSPCCRADVDFEKPRWRWSGGAYADTNWGAAPLEDDFSGWSWSRASFADGDTEILYDAVRRDGSRLELARRFQPTGTCEAVAMPPRQDLPRGLWGVERATHGTNRPRLLRSLEDSPFYTRSLIAMDIGGEPATAMHESLSLDRFRSRWVRALLPFRMPRDRG